MADFNKAYKKTIVHEGGWANVPGDRGGKTYMGIASVSYPKWKGWKILNKYLPLERNEIVNDVALDNAVRTFYKKQIWDVIWGDKINDQRVAEFIYDYTVHSGARGVRAAQKCLPGLEVDGIMGPKTLKAINNSGADSLFLCMKMERLNFLLNLSKAPGQLQFKNGWINRVNSFI